jgi:hypothetical protein
MIVWGASKDQEVSAQIANGERHAPRESSPK